MPTQQYYSGAYMEENVHDLTTKIRLRKKSMTYNYKEEVEGTLHFKTSKNNIMHTIFYSNLYKFTGNYQGMLNEVIYKTTIQNMHKLGWKEKLF